MRMIIDIPDYNLDEVQNGSIACGQILKAVKNGKVYKESPEFRWTDKLSVNNNGDIIDFYGQVLEHLDWEIGKSGEEK